MSLSNRVDGFIPPQISGSSLGLAHPPGSLTEQDFDPTALGTSTGKASTEMKSNQEPSLSYDSVTPQLASSIEDDGANISSCIIVTYMRHHYLQYFPPHLSIQGHIMGEISKARSRVNFSWPKITVEGRLIVQSNGSCLGHQPVGQVRLPAL